MKAFILAAGLGTRLRPWTLEHPKALVPVEGVSMLRRVIEKLVAEGFADLGINVCHFAEQLKDYLEKEDIRTWLKERGVKTIVSDETGNLMDTGGGIVKIAPALDPLGEGILVHNADILSNACLADMRKAHIGSGTDVTLLVSDRDSSRKLTFGEDGGLLSWRNLNTGEVKMVADKGCSGEELAFSGIYIVGGNAWREMIGLYGNRPFGVMDYFLNPHRQCKVVGWKQPGLQLLDIGKPDSLKSAAGFLRGLNQYSMV